VSWSCSTKIQPTHKSIGAMVWDIKEIRVIPEQDKARKRMVTDIGTIKHIALGINKDLVKGFSALLIKLNP